VVPPRSALALAACALLVLAFAPAQYFGRQQDDLLYYIGARALTEGRYCLLTTPGCPPLTMINPGWPLLMTPLAFLTDRPAAFQAFSALILASTPLAVWAWMRRRGDETTALLVAALFASCPLVLAQSGAPMSETPYLLALLGMLAAVEAARPRAAGFLAALLLLLRTAGVAALAALLIPFLRARRWRDAIAAAWPPALAYSLWAAWSWRKTHGLDKAQLLAGTYAEGSWSKPLRMALANARYYLSEWGGCFLPPSRTSGHLALMLGAALAAGACLGLARALRRRAHEPAAWALLGAAALHAFWGWQYERYLIPVLPLLLWALVEGLRQRAKPTLAVLLTLQLLMQTLPRLGRPSPWARPELALTYEWLSARRRPALLASVEHVRDGYYCGLPNVPLPDDARDEDFAARLKALRVGYVLRAEGLDLGLDADPGSPLRRGVERAFSHLDEARLFRKVHEEPEEHAAVYAPL